MDYSKQKTASRANSEVCLIHRRILLWYWNCQKFTMTDVTCLYNRGGNHWSMGDMSQCRSAWPRSLASRTHATEMPLLHPWLGTGPTEVKPFSQMDEFCVCQDLPTKLSCEI